MEIRFYYVTRKGNELLARKRYNDCPVPRSGESIMVGGKGYIAMRCIYDLDVEVVHVLCRSNSGYAADAEGKIKPIIN